MRHDAISLVLLCGLCGACTSSNGIVDPAGQPLTPGTIPKPQPITTQYPLLPSDIWSQGGGSQLNDARSSARGPAAGAVIAPHFAPADGSHIFGLTADSAGNLYCLSVDEIISLDEAGAVRWRAPAADARALLLGSDGLLRVAGRDAVIALRTADGVVEWASPSYRKPQGSTGFVLIGADSVTYEVGIN